MKIRVWLVHGTWAKSARWTLDGSRLRKTLQEGLEGEVTFETFPWTGRNRTFDRGEAARQLLDSLRAGRDEPQATFVIAHSHGGNIAATADYMDAYEAYQAGAEARDKRRLLDGV